MGSLEDADFEIVLGALGLDRLGEIATLWVTSWSEAMPDLDFESRREWLVGYLAELTRKGVILRGAFAEDEALLGFITIETATGYIDQIAVAPSAKGKGVAAALIGEARRLSPGRLDLDVNEANPRARRFYEKQGFIQVGTGTSERTGLPLIKLRWMAGVIVGQAAQQQQQ